MTTEEDDEIPTFVIDTEEKYLGIWAKTKEGFRRTYEEFYDKIDWVMKADDDTYVVLENLRYLLSSYNKSEPIWFGCEFKVIVKDGYMSGGAGYVLSKESLKRFATESLTDPSKCKQQANGMEDVEMGNCLKAVGVRNEDSRDNLGRFRFLPFTPGTHIGHRKWNSQGFWYWGYLQHEERQVNIFSCKSDSRIANFYICPKNIKHWT